MEYTNQLGLHKNFEGVCEESFKHSSSGATPLVKDPSSLNNLKIKQKAQWMLTMIYGSI